MCGCNKQKQLNYQNPRKNNFIQQVKTATAAAVEVITGEAVLVDDDVYNRRLRTCGNCDYLERYHRHLPKGADLSKLDRCGECGCFVKAKAKFAGENFKCPKNFW